MERELDVIIFGASGYTGQWSIKESVKLFPDLRWGIAGRSKEKLVAVLKEKGDEIGRDLSHILIIIADTNDEDSIRQMTEQCKVIVSFCGPYRLYGEVVIRACIETGTHFIDVTAEEQFVYEMELKYNEKAYDRGVYVINACGVVSVFGDMGVIFLENNFDGQLNSIETFFGIDEKKKPENGYIHYASWETAILQYKNYKNTKTRKYNKFSVSNCLRNLSTFKNKVIVPMISLDTEIISRTQTKLYEVEQKRPVPVNPYFISSFPHLIRILIIAIVFVTFNLFKIGQSLLFKYPRFFSLGVVSEEGMSEVELRNINVYMLLRGIGWSSSENQMHKPKKEIITKITGPDAGYITSVICALLSAKTVLNERHKIPLKGGVITPGTAFARTNYIEELSQNDIKFEIINNH